MIKTNNLRYIIKILQQQIHWNQFCHLHWCLQQQASHQRLNLRLLQDLKALSLVHLLKWIHLHSCPLLGIRLSILRFFRLTGMTYLFNFNITNYLFFLYFYYIFKMEGFRGAWTILHNKQASPVLGFLFRSRTLWLPLPQPVGG